MRVISISYPTPLSEIKDVDNDNVDVFVELENGMELTLVVATPKNLDWYINRNGDGFLEAGPPDIIVRSITHDNIRKAIESYSHGNAYWLKLYYLAGLGEGTFDIELLDDLIEKSNG